MQVKKENNKNHTISEESNSTCSDLMSNKAKRKTEIGQSDSVSKCDNFSTPKAQSVALIEDRGRNSTDIFKDPLQYSSSGVSTFTASDKARFKVTFEDNVA